LVSKDDEGANHRVLDMSDSMVIRRAIDTIHERLGKNVEIYGVGFSLGANHLLRYLGDHYHDSGMKGAISISNPFDVMAATIKLKSKFFGIYDKSIHAMLSKPFIE
jgi:predicted alpha/beta-fold hydrolase